MSAVMLWNPLSMRQRIPCERNNADKRNLRQYGKNRNPSLYVSRQYNKN